RAAAFLLMKTEALPLMIVARFDGGLENEPPIGTCGGVFVAVLLTVAAASPSMFTSELSEPSMMPVNGCGVGVGTGPPGVGTRMMCVSVAVTWSLCLAAGCPISTSVDVDRRAFDGELRRRLNGHVGGSLDLDRLRVDLQRAGRRGDV